MAKVRSSIVTRIIVVATLVLFMIAQHPGPLSSAEVVKATVEVKHKPLKHFVAGHRISVEAKVADPQGVSLVRCYFRAAGQADYVFVGMKAGQKDTFAGILPSPAAETKAIEYLFLTVNGKNQVAKTQVFKTESKDTKDIPAWQSTSVEGTIAVSTELAQATEPAGFNDSITTDVVESSARFGIVAGIYSAAQATAAGGSAAAVSGTSGAAAIATDSGTVVASTGLSTMMIAGASAAAILVGAVVVGASGGGGGDAVTQGEATNTSSWRSWTVPDDPGPGQDVVVYVDVRSSGVAVSYTVTGTDGYSDRGTIVSDGNGQITFQVPGAEATVTDTITVSVPSWGPSYTRTWQYVF